MANEEVHIGDDWYLDENDNGDLIFYNSRKNEVVKAIDVITGAEDKKKKKLENVNLPHSELSSVSADDHHAKTTSADIDHDSISGVSANDHHNPANQDVDSVDGYDIQKNGAGGTGIINFIT